MELLQVTSPEEQLLRKDMATLVRRQQKDNSNRSFSTGLREDRPERLELILLCVSRRSSCPRFAEGRSRHDWRLEVAVSRRHYSVPLRE